MNDYQVILYFVYKWTDIVITAFDPWTLGSPANMLAAALVTWLLNLAAWMRKNGYAVYSKAFHNLKGKRFRIIRRILATHYLMWSLIVFHLIDEIHDLGWETQELKA